jgi:RNA polymerase sigma factor (sigma-70 family)
MSTPDVPKDSLPQEPAVSEHGSVTAWLARLKGGEAEAARPLWQRYFHDLLWRARQRLGRGPHPYGDEEDVVVSAFASFCKAVEQGRFPKLDDRDDLWQVLLLITERKAIDLYHRGRRISNGGRVLDEAALAGPDGAAVPGSLDAVLAPEPTPAFAAEVAESVQRMLERLGDDELRQIALRKLEGYTNEEVAAEFDMARATVERRLRLIRKRWASERGP